MSEKSALHFGYVKYGGHALVDAALRSRSPREVPGFPWDYRLLDGGLLANRKVPDQPDGRVHATCGGIPDLWIAFFWWDRSGDQRGASNSGFYVSGFEWAERAAAFDFACRVFPSIVARQKFPLVLVEMEST